MFNEHKKKLGTTKQLLHWQAEWFKKFLRTWYHILYRPAYWKWRQMSVARRVMQKERRLLSMLDDEHKCYAMHGIFVHRATAIRNCNKAVEADGDNYHDWEVYKVPFNTLVAEPVETKVYSSPGDMLAGLEPIHTRRKGDDA